MFAATDPRVQEFIGQYGTTIAIGVAVFAALMVSRRLLRAGRRAAGTWLMLGSLGVSVPGWTAARSFLKAKGWWPA